MRRPEFVARHGRRPEGWFGRILASLMAWETNQANQAALAALEIQPGDRVLEIGFGHGRTIAAAARLTRGGLVAGVDFSPSMVAMARRHNRALLARGLADLRHADSRHLPFADASFDRALSVHTVYFWEQPLAHLQEVRRVLRPGGRFVLGFRPASEQMSREFPASVYTFRPACEIRDLLLTAGFHRLEFVEPESGGGIVLAIAT
jgi:ubiquinone/menaquinone biosynthesis C-methylase UbiE